MYYIVLSRPLGNTYFTIFAKSSKFFLEFTLMEFRFRPVLKKNMACVHILTHLLTHRVLLIMLNGFIY